MDKNKKEIPSKYKCSRCHKDMRIDGSKGCQCNKRHQEFVGSKSGSGINYQNIIYHGFYNY